MHVLIGLDLYKNITGSELYVYEIARELKRLGHKVDIVAISVGGEITDRTRSFGIGVWNYNNLPQIQPDVLHLNQRAIQEIILPRFNCRAVYTMHSSTISNDRPLLNSKISKYICIRPDVYEKALSCGVPDEKIVIINNGFNTDRFNRSDCFNAGYVLYVGTVNQLRYKSIIDAIEMAKRDGKQFKFVGEDYGGFIAKLMKKYNHISLIPTSVWNIEEYVKYCDETAGIFLGRTTIEGWLCGKPGWIYDVDENGNILNKGYFNPPENMSIYDIKNVVNRLLKVYESTEESR